MRSCIASAGEVVLAPFYDLVPTGLYADVGRALAMRIGAAEHIDRLSVEDWQAFAAAAELGTGFVRGRVRDVARALVDVLPAARDAIAAVAPDGAVLTQDCAALSARSRAMSEERPVPQPDAAWPQRAPWA